MKTIDQIVQDHRTAYKKLYSQRTLDAIARRILAGEADFRIGRRYRKPLTRRQRPRIRRPPVVFQRTDIDRAIVDALSTGIVRATVTYKVCKERIVARVDGNRIYGRHEVPGGSVQPKFSSRRTVDVVAGVLVNHDSGIVACRLYDAIVPIRVGDGSLRTIPRNDDDRVRDEIILPFPRTAPHLIVRACASTDYRGVYDSKMVIDRRLAFVVDDGVLDARIRRCACQSGSCAG